MNFSDASDDMPVLKKTAHPKKRMRMGCIVPLCLLVAVIIVVIFLPRILSTTPMRAIILQKVNAKLAPVKVDAKWKLRWWGEQNITDVRYEDPAHAMVFECERIVATPHVTSLIPPLTRPNLGKVLVQRPKVLVDLRTFAPAAVDTPVSVPPRVTPSDLPRVTETRPATPVVETKKPAYPKWLENVTMELVIEDGRIDEVEPSRVMIDKLQGALSLKTFSAPVIVSLEGSSGAEGVTFSATLPALRTLQTAPLDYAMRAVAHLEMRQVDVRCANVALEFLGIHPWLGNGVATGSLSLEPSQDAVPRTTVRADVTIADFALLVPGAPTRMTEHEALTLKTVAELARSGVTLQEFAFSSAWMNTLAHGELKKSLSAAVPLGKINGSAQAFLPEIANDFGALLKLPEGTKLSRGVASADFTAEGSDYAMTYTLNGKLDNFHATHNGQPVTFAPAPTLEMELSWPYTAPPVLSHLELQLPFLKIKGKGSLDATEISGGMDFDLFTQKYGGLFAFMPKCAGALVFDVNTTRAGDMMQVTATANTTGFAVTLPEREPFSPGTSKLTFAGQVPLSDNMKPKTELRKVKTEVEVGSLQVQASCAQLTLPPEGDPLIRALELGVKGELAVLTKLAAPWLPKFQTYAPKGVATLNITAESTGGKTRMQFVSLLRNASLTTHQFDIQEPGARFDGGATYSATNKVLTLSNVQFKSTAASSSSEKLTLQFARDADRKLPLVNGAFNVEANLAEIAAWQRSGIATPSKRFQGKLKLQADVSTPDAAGDTAVSLDATLVNTVYPLKVPLHIEHGSLHTRMALATDAEALTVHEAALRLPFLSADVAGRITALSSAMHADFTGTMTPDLSMISPFLPAELTEAGFRISGREARPVKFTADLADGVEALRLRGYASLAVFIESLSIFGMTASAADAMLTLKNGMLDVLYTPKIDSGVVTFNPTINTAAYPMTLSFASPLPLFDKVPLTSALADALLVYVNPIMKGSAQLSGLITLSLQADQLPLDETWKTSSFDGHVQLEKLQLTPGALLGDILTAINIAPKSLRVTLDDYTSAIVCRDGRIATDPMTLMLKDMPAKFEGSTTLSGTINYLATLPLTEKIVGDTAWKYAKGVKLTVAIGGTVTKPVIDTRKLAQQLGAIIRDAAKSVSTEQAVDLLQKIRDELRK